MAERSLGVGALVLIGAAGVDGTVGMLDHLLALPLFATVGVTGVGGSPAPSGATQRAPWASRSTAGGPTSGRSFTFEQRALLRERTLLEAALESITVPTTVVVGSRDLVVRPKAQRALAGRISGARLVEHAREPAT